MIKLNVHNILYKNILIKLGYYKTKFADFLTTTIINYIILIMTTYNDFK